MISNTLARRENPTRDEFVAMLGGDVSPATAEFLWDTMIPYLMPKLTPHPIDHLALDLPIDDDDPTMEWLPAFAELHGRDHKDWPNWPSDWKGTVRNYAKWLESGLPNEQIT
jgi:hypothetical protein